MVFGLGASAQVRIRTSPLSPSSYRWRWRSRRSSLTFTPTRGEPPCLSSSPPAPSSSPSSSLYLFWSQTIVRSKQPDILLSVSCPVNNMTSKERRASLLEDVCPMDEVISHNTLSISQVNDCHKSVRGVRSVRGNSSIGRKRSSQVTWIQ